MRARFSSHNLARGSSREMHEAEKPRSFVVPTRALEVLVEHREQQENDKFFVSPKAVTSVRTVRARAFVELMRKAGLKGVSLHSLRHTHASELLSQGVRIATVAKRLGRADATFSI